MTKGQGKTVLITGASAGIGFATAELLLEKGWNVYAAARRVERLEPLKNKGAQPLYLDVTNEASMVTAVDTLLEREDGIDALVNNAGYGEYGALEDVPLDKARYQFEVNVFGLARLTQLVLPTMREARAGRIINIGSIAGRFSLPMGGWYHATKYAVEALSDALRLEVASFGIDVVLVEPGVIHSEWSDISVQTLRESSASGPYCDLARHVADSFQQNYAKGGMGASPDVIARLILDALEAPRPATRYRAPFHAKLFVMISRLVPDRLLDMIKRQQLGIR